MDSKYINILLDKEHQDAQHKCINAFDGETLFNTDFISVAIEELVEIVKQIKSQIDTSVNFTEKLFKLSDGKNLHEKAEKLIVFDRIGQSTLLGIEDTLTKYRQVNHRFDRYLWLLKRASKKYRSHKAFRQLTYVLVSFIDYVHKNSIYFPEVQELSDNVNVYNTTLYYRLQDHVEWVENANPEFIVDDEYITRELVAFYASILAVIYCSLENRRYYNFLEDGIPTMIEYINTTFYRNTKNIQTLEQLIKYTRVMSETHFVLSITSYYWNFMREPDELTDTVTQFVRFMYYYSWITGGMTHAQIQ